jgi:hypothetical protein
MNAEWYLILSCLAGTFLFVAGGTEIPFFKTGFKWLRREILPLIWGLLALSAGFEWWRCLAFAVCQDVAFRLPYGDRTPTWLKLIVFMALPLPSLWFGFTVWQIISGLLCFILWALSNWKPTANIMSWVIACLLMGAALGITIGKLIAQAL